MCGLIGGFGRKKIGKNVFEGLSSLEYRGYDSAGFSWLDSHLKISTEKTLDGVADLFDTIKNIDNSGVIGHSRWATHGKPSLKNAHPHCSGKVSIVHNGIIENHKDIKEKLLTSGIAMSGDTDSECISYLIEHYYEDDWTLAFIRAVKDLQGAFAIAALIDGEDYLLFAKNGSPLTIGLGSGGNYISSSIDGLSTFCDRFMIVGDNEFGKINSHTVEVFDNLLTPIDKRVHESINNQQSCGLGDSESYMMKEINEQPEVILSTILSNTGDTDCVYGAGFTEILQETKSIKIVSCGTSYNAGLLAKYWVEEFCGIRCDVEVASEFIYRECPIVENELHIFISQSGETADTIKAIKKVKNLDSGITFSICNSLQSELVRLSDYHFITRAGKEVGVASTKAFTTQLVSLFGLITHINKAKNNSDEFQLDSFRLVNEIKHVLSKKDSILEFSEKIAKAKSCYFIGRGVMFPIAVEGALKLKEISYIHAEAYPGGELKHGPLALIDENMPVVALSMASSDIKIISNIEEIRSRGGEVIVFDEAGHNKILSPIIMSVYLQILSYQVADILGRNIDKPRNLAKSVTVE
jgi:glucosamine--fructose-6-phosphate aminotransferase (isomerizing)